MILTNGIFLNKVKRYTMNKLYLKSFLSSVLKIGYQKSSSEKTKKQQRFLISLGLLMSIGGVFWGNILLYLELYFQALIPFSYMLITCINFFYLYKIKDFKRVRFIQMSISFTLPIAFHILMGGFCASGAVVLWSIYAIFASFTFQEQNQTKKWLILYLIILTFLVYFNTSIEASSLGIPGNITLLFFTLNISIITLSIYTLFLNYIKSEEQLREELYHLVNTDTLTNIPNRRAINQKIHNELTRFKREKVNFCLMLLDIDHFKKINDTYGHEIGDRVLFKFAKFLHTSVPSLDFVGRYGGEEFIIILPETSIENARIFGEQLIKKCAQNSISTSKGNCQFSVSIGLSFINETDQKMSDIINRADEALYVAKKNGRNQLQSC